MKRKELINFISLLLNSMNLSLRINLDFYITTIKYKRTKIVNNQLFHISNKLLIKVMYQHYITQESVIKVEKVQKRIQQWRKSFLKKHVIWEMIQLVLNWDIFIWNRHYNLNQIVNINKQQNCLGKRLRLILKWQNLTFIQVFCFRMVMELLET